MGPFMRFLLAENGREHDMRRAIVQGSADSQRCPECHAADRIGALNDGPTFA